MNKLRINILDFQNNKTFFEVDFKLLNYINALLENLNTQKFSGYFRRTFSMYPRFKSKLITNKLELNDYYKRCNFLSILQSMGMISGCLQIYSNSIGLIKIGPSKNFRKNSCIIDDSTILDLETNLIRDSIGDDLEPHRGYRLFYNFQYDKQLDIITVFDFMLGQLTDIFVKCMNNKYLFDPINILQRIIIFCKNKGYLNVISYLSWEIHDSPHLLSIDEKIELFNDSDNLYYLWNSDFITNNQGKLRIYIMCCYFIELLERGNIREF